MQVGYLVSSFDMLNVGDLDVIGQATKLCTELTAVVLSDDSISQALGRPPVVPLRERFAIVEHVRGVVRVTEADDAMPQTETELVFTTPELFDLVVSRHPDVIVLEPTTKTRSSVLGAALQPMTSPDVAGAVA